MSFVNKYEVLPDDFVIGVGFGYAALLCNGHVVWKEGNNPDISIDENGITVKEAKQIVKENTIKFPIGADVVDELVTWEIVMEEPFGLGRYVYINGEFVLYKKGEGFA